MLALLSGLTESSASLQELLSGASGNFANVEEQLTDRLADFHTIFGSVTQEMGGIKASAEATLEEARAVAETLRSQQENLAASAQAFVQTQSQIDSLFRSRGQMLEGLLQTIEERRNGFEAAMRSYLVTIENSLAAAETRAAELGTFVSGTVQASSGLVERQFSEIRGTMDAERTRTADALRSACVETKTELEALFAETTHRFQSAAEEMQTMARSIRQELEANYAEMRRYSVDLPRETAEQMSALRKIVAEQVEALGELETIVGRAGETFEPKPVPRSGGNPFERLKEARGTAIKIPSEDSKAPQAPRINIPASNGSAQTQERGAGWLSDLLARASTEDEIPVSAPPEKSRINGLLSIDIAKMIDHSALAEAWDRYRHGDSAAFSRSNFYRGNGQQIFEELRRGYKNDASFHAMIDRYVADFDQNLQDVEAQGQDEQKIKTMLLSANGKVYTMLAHAAGRLN
jgi:archaellum component FlaC